MPIKAVSGVQRRTSDTIASPTTIGATIEQRAPPHKKLIDGNRATAAAPQQRTRVTRTRRDPRRSTVAINFGALGGGGGEKTRHKGAIAAGASLQRSPNAPHIRPTDANIERVRREIEAVQQRRCNEKQLQLQAYQRRIGEISVRIAEVARVGKYLEKALLHDRRNRFELEQWLSYSQVSAFSTKKMHSKLVCFQQYEELRFEQTRIQLFIKITALEADYQRLKAQLHEAQRDNNGEEQVRDFSLG